MQTGKVISRARLTTFVCALLATMHPAVAEAALCTVSASAMNFGAYDPLAAIANDSSTNILVLCIYRPPPATEVVSYTLSISTGPGTYSARHMLQGASIISYNLYTTPSRDSSNIWGDGTAGSTTLSASLPPLTATNLIRFANHGLYGRIPARQDIPVGTYSASVLLTITF